MLLLRFYRSCAMGLSCHTRLFCCWVGLGWVVMICYVLCVVLFRDVPQPCFLAFLLSAEASRVSCKLWFSSDETWCLVLVIRSCWYSWGCCMSGQLYGRQDSVQCAGLWAFRKSHGAVGLTKNAGRNAKKGAYV